jgi:hypothetical protein
MVLKLHNPHFKGLILAVVVLAGMIFLAKVVGLNAGVVFALALGVILLYSLREMFGGKK